MKHFPGHQQVLIKDNLVVAVLSFPEHSASLFEQEFMKFNYDTIIDLCEIKRSANIGDLWDGFEFISKPFPS